MRDLPDQLRTLLEAPDEGDPAVDRLFPPGYADEHADRNAEYAVLTRDDLTERRLAGVAEMASTIDADRLTEEQLLAWLGAINDLRLVLGVRLDVTEETVAEDFEGDPRAPTFALYGYLSWLEEDIVTALSS